LENSFDNVVEFDILYALEQANSKVTKNPFSLAKSQSLTPAAKMFLYSVRHKINPEITANRGGNPVGLAELAPDLSYLILP
jgi:hypothetical protein